MNALRTFVLHTIGKPIWHWGPLVDARVLLQVDHSNEACRIEHDVTGLYGLSMKGLFIGMIRLNYRSSTSPLSSENQSR